MRGGTKHRDDPRAAISYLSGGREIVVLVGGRELEKVLS
jgi:hypothetical protein